MATKLPVGGLNRWSISVAGRSTTIVKTISYMPMLWRTLPSP